MITKILFTIAVIGAVVLFTRYFAGRQGPRPAAPAPGRARPAAPVRLAAYGVIVLIVAASALWIVLEWRSAHEILRIRVINSATGVAAEYEAYRSDIEQRSFRTVDGRRVNLAEVERLEVGNKEVMR